MRKKKDLLHETEEEQLRRYRHIMRMEDCRIARQIAEWNPQGKMRRGRPVSTWKDGIRNNTQRRNPKDEEYFE
jgi:hypothetical protein